MACVVRRVPRSFHGRHRHVYAGALALSRASCAMVARVACRSAATARREDRLAQRHGAVSRLEAAAGAMIARRAIVACGVLAAAAPSAWACGEALGPAARQVAGARYDIAFV